MIFISMLNIFYDFFLTNQNIPILRNILLMIMFLIFLFMPLVFNKFYMIDTKFKYSFEWLSKLLYLSFLIILILSVFVSYG